ncbi:MAG TPA: glycosyltransferase [Methylomirabilota bacterium]|nr:glycosyltransferase [Methylomirabilota bacterium]
MTALTVSMIVRDAEGFLPECLQSVRLLSPEIVIADTGSTDRSVEIAREFGAKVIHIPWQNNFAEARNRALAEASGDWILSLDADEQLDPSTAAGIPALFENKTVAAYQVTIRNYVKGANERIWDTPPKANDSLLGSAAAYPAFVEHENIRLFRRSAEIYFVGRVHESVGPRLRELKRTLGRANFFIHHFGFAVDAATKARKNGLYREMGRQKLLEFPKDWQAHLEQGLLELEEYKNLPEARVLFSRACELNPSSGVSWFFLSLTIFRMGLYEDALNFLRQAEQAGQKTALVAETRGDAYYNLAKFDEARASYEAALKRQNGSMGVLPKLCLAMIRSGKAEKGLARLRSALTLTPQVAEIHEGLILALVFLNRLEDAAQASDEKLRLVQGLLPTDYLRSASLWAQVRNWQLSSHALELGLIAHSGNAHLTRALDEIFLASGVQER